MRSTHLTGWRRIANAAWRAPSDPQIYGVLEVDATAALALIAAHRHEGRHVTMTHVVGRGLAHAIRSVPELNVRLLGGRAVPRSSVDIFFITAVDAGTDLTGVKIAQTDQKGLARIAEELEAGAHRLRGGEDESFSRTKRLMDALPVPILRRVLKASVTWAGDLGWSLPVLGLPAEPFGSAMVSSVGPFGLPQGFAPLAWMYRVPIIVVASTVTDRPVAIDGKIEIRPILPVSATIDHRYADGAHLGRAMKAFRAYLEDPTAFEPPP